MSADNTPATPRRFRLIIEAGPRHRPIFSELTGTLDELRPIQFAAIRRGERTRIVEVRK